MDYNLNLETMREECRICLQKGDTNIWHNKVPLETNEAVENAESICDSMDKTFFELMDVFTNQQDLLILTNEFPYICWQCLEDLKFCSFIYEKIKQANIRLNILYEESLNQCIDEEHLIEYEEDEQVKTDTEQISNEPVTQSVEMVSTDHLSSESSEQQFLAEEVIQDDDNLLHINRSKRITLDSNDAFVVTQFIPATLDKHEKDFHPHSNRDEEQHSPTAQHLLTMSLKAVEVKDIKNLENPQILDSDSFQPAIYVCQHCPQAFAKSDYLKTHIQKSHVCQFCTQAFSLTEDLFKHIREVHTEHKCVICHKILSSHTNLRHHIKRVHRIKLPAKVTLIDFIKSTNQNENQSENKIEELQDVEALSDIEPSIQYIWTNDENT